MTLQLLSFLLVVGFCSAALHMQLGKEPRAAEEGGKRLSSGFILIELSQLQLTSFSKEMSIVYGFQFKRVLLVGTCIQCSEQ